jgi:MoxR-like ATPase
MSKRQIDISTEFSKIDYDREPPEKEIEDPNVKEGNTLKKIPKEPYLFEPQLKQAIDLAIALGRPLLLQGEPGCGKTSLAYAVAYALGLPLEISYIKSTSRAKDLLYTYDVVNRLYDAQIAEAKSQNIAEYIQFAPLGRAIARAQAGRRSVVLIDEIDKADLDFPNDLLWELDRLEFQIDEIPGHTYTVDDPKLRPIAIVTHNEEKALPAAFLRRCIFHYIEFPKDKERLQEVLKVQEFKNVELSKKAIEIILRLRDIELTKKPGLSELVDWVGYLEAVNMPIEQLDDLPHIGALLKLEIDIRRVKSHFNISQGNV